MNNKFPKLRFPGFNDSWKRYALSEIGEYYSTSALSYADLSEDGMYKCVLYGDLFTKYNEQLFDVKARTNVEATLTQKNDILFPTSTTVNDLSLIAPSCVSEDNIRAGGDMFGIRPHSEIDGNFISYYINNHMPVKRSFAKKAQGLTIVHIHYDAIKNEKLYLPSYREQLQISEFLMSIDKLVALHQKKLQEIELYKAGMIQKLFPKTGCTVPEIRFPKFTDDWKEYKLGDIYSERNEKGNDSLQFLTVSIHSGVSDKELDADDLGKTVKRSEDKSTYKHVYEGDLVFNMMRAWQGAIGVAKSEGMISPAYISAIPNDEVFPQFMDYTLRRKDVIEQINNLSYGVTDFRKRLYWNSFVKVKCMLPSKEEQEIIWGFLKQIDDLIELYQKKIKVLKEYKKGLCQQMFI
nr:restriction endonuclease subunit S [uncultured Butyrivibrio sp.]